MIVERNRLDNCVSTGSRCNSTIDGDFLTSEIHSGIWAVKLRGACTKLELTIECAVACPRQH